MPQPDKERGILPKPSSRRGLKFQSARGCPKVCSSHPRSIRLPNAARWQPLKPSKAQAYVTRTWGDCYGYLLVATGRAEVMVDPILNVWDAAAVQPIIEEAGGTFTDWQGKSSIHAGEAIATNGRVTDEVLAITRAISPAV